MATFLDLVNDLERESGTIQKGSRLSTVANPPARQEKMVEWVAEAWRLIQLERTDWPWMMGEFDGPLAPSVQRYTGSALGLADFGQWPKRSFDYEPFTVYDPDIGRKDEQRVRFIDWRCFKDMWDRNVSDWTRPTDVAISPDGMLCVGATPNKGYRMRGEYRRRAQILTINADVPRLPEEHHNIIVWHAMMLLGDHDESPITIQTARAKYSASLRALVNDSIGQATI